MQQNITQSDTGLPPGVQGDFIDDIINNHKQQIVAGILGAATDSIAFSGGESKYYIANKCASCSKFKN